MIRSDPRPHADRQGTRVSATGGPVLGRIAVEVHPGAQRSVPPSPPRRSGPYARTPPDDPTDPPLVCRRPPSRPADQRLRHTAARITEKWHESGQMAMSRGMLRRTVVSVWLEIERTDTSCCLLGQEPARTLRLQSRACFPRRLLTQSLAVWARPLPSTVRGAVVPWCTGN